MEDDDASFLPKLRAEREIHRVLLKYCRGSDRKDFDLMRDAYHDDAYDDHGPFKGYIDEYIAWARVHHEKFHQLLHMLGHPLIDLRDGVAYVETHCLLLQHFKAGAFGPQSPQYKSQILCRYLDRFEKRSNAWKIAHRVVVYDWVRKEWVEDQFAPFPIGADFHVSQRSHEDLVYRMPELSKPARTR